MGDIKMLSSEDFDLKGEYGSQGAKLEQIGENHFKIILGTAPNDPLCSNRPQFIIKRNAKGKSLRLDVETPMKGGGNYPITEYAYSWSYDNENWNPIEFEKKDSAKNVLIFPRFEEDQVYFGHQVPMSYEKMVQMIEDYKTNPNINAYVIGESLNGRSIYRIEITDPNGPYDRKERWVHYFANVHPGEHNSQWRMIGMIDWILSDEGKDFRQRSICHFVLMMSVDGPTNGWYRVNKQGLDMNRSYLPTGSNKDKQAYEAYVCQKDLEQIMDSESPVTTLWNMHTWPGIVEPIITLGPEFSTNLGDWTLLKEIMKQNDPKGYIKPLQNSAERKPGGPACIGWDGGPAHQFHITTVLCEGASVFKTKQENIESGIYIIKALAKYYRNTKYQ